MTDKLTVWITVGAPGSGKSTWAKKFIEKNPDTVRVCPDVIRAKIGTGEGDQSVSYPAFCIAKDEIREALDNGKNVIFDATNMYRRVRRDFINIAHGHGAQAVGMVFEVDKLILLERIKKRVSDGGLYVSEEVIDDMLSRYQRPELSEFDKVVFV